VQDIEIRHVEQHHWRPPGAAENEGLEYAAPKCILVFLASPSTSIGAHWQRLKVGLVYWDGKMDGQKI